MGRSIGGSGGVGLSMRESIVHLCRLERRDRSLYGDRGGVLYRNWVGHSVETGWGTL